MAEEEVRSEIWLLDNFPQHGEDTWAKLSPKHSGQTRVNTYPIHMCLSSDQSTAGQVEPPDLSGATEPRGQKDL